MHKILTIAAVFAVFAVLTAAPAAAGAASPATCIPATEPAHPAAPFEAPMEASTCTDCKACSSNADCGTGQCLLFKQSPLICEDACTEVLPRNVCSLSCDPCTSTATCPSGESCIPTLQAGCIAEPITVCPEKVCVC